MATKNSQILLIENVLSNLNEHINEKEREVQEFENETAKLKNTISTLKFECKSAFDEQEKLEETVAELKKQNHLYSEQLKTKEQQLNVKEKEFEAFKLQNEQFVDNVENKIEEFKKQLEDKNSIIAELEAMNRSLNEKLQNTQKNGDHAISRLQRKLEQEEIKSFVNSNSTGYDLPNSKYEKLEAAMNTPKIEKQNTNLKLDKLESKLKPQKKEEKILNNAHVQTEEDILKEIWGSKVMTLTALQLKTSDNFSKNLHKLIKNIQKTEENSLILAPELFLSGYAYDRLDEAVEIGLKAVKRLKKLSFNKTIAITLTTKKDGNYFNTLHIFNKGKIVHKQSKYQLFVMNEERKHFTAGDSNDIRIVEIDGIKIAALICFELRFIELWQKLQGADIILVPAMWGKLRKGNFETLTTALAVANQCFVLACDSANDNMARSSAVISPFGNITLDDKAKVISKEIDLKEIKKMRRYLNVGIK